ncbi:TAXI family TRAP transporter solute-binding subunit [Tardiphaga alba]|uniref:TAXI family TRAP transporter solute-binding subunit n=2 Tax=Tardiphaga alba TaxID=340268 RepID=A0ABX8AET4_9BRAD|nr:TAXI family TRAP transporter solute-binding subunit [Tardiphaga alba]
MTGRRCCIALVAGMFALWAPLARAEPIAILTGGSSGVYYPLGVSIGMVYADIPGAKVLVETTDGSVANLMRLQQGTGQVAFALGDALMAGWRGDAQAGFAGKLDGLRVIGALYPNYVQIVATKASGIRSLKDLQGKSLAVGAEKSGTELEARAILKAAGMNFASLGRAEMIPFAESTKRMIDNKLDASLQSAGLGVTSIKELTDNSDTVLVPVSPAVVKKLGAPFRPATIPADTYRGQPKPVPTASVMNYLVTSASVSDELVYQMTKRLFDAVDGLAVAHRAGHEIKLAAAVSRSPVPLHPGAVRYYREKGLIK